MNAAGLPTTEDEIVWPTDAEVAGALAEYASLVAARYGERLHGLYLFGSRARGDHRPMSDADVAVVLADGDWVEWKERRALAGLAYELILDIGVVIQPWPVPISKWAAKTPDTKGFLSGAHRDARPIGEL